MIELKLKTAPPRCYKSLNEGGLVIKELIQMAMPCQSFY